MIYRHARFVADCQFSTAMTVQSASPWVTVYSTALGSAIWQGSQHGAKGGTCVQLVNKLPLVSLRPWNWRAVYSYDCSEC